MKMPLHLKVGGNHAFDTQKHRYLLVLRMQTSACFIEVVLDRSIITLLYSRSPIRAKVVKTKYKS